MAPDQKYPGTPSYKLAWISLEPLMYAPPWARLIMPCSVLALLTVGWLGFFTSNCSLQEVAKPNTSMVSKTDIFFIENVSYGLETNVQSSLIRTQVRHGVMVGTTVPRGTT